MQDRLVFLIGAPRSGTTLTTRMLGSHPRIHAPAEPHLIPPLAHLGFHDRVERAPYDPVITQIGLRELVGTLPGKEADYLDALRMATDHLYGKALETAGGDRLFLDKTPAYALVLDFLVRLYPDAKYVVLTRHPIAVWSSIIDSFFDGDHEAAHAHNPILERYVPALARFLRDGDVAKHHLRYEDMVQDPEHHMHEVCEFLGIEFDPGIVDYGKRGSAETSARGLGDPVTVAKETRPTTASVDKWVKGLETDAGRLAQCREIAAHLTDPDLATLGYDGPELRSALSAIAPRAAGPGGVKMTRYALERRILVTARKHTGEGKPVGNLVRFLRNACDILLR